MNHQSQSELLRALISIFPGFEDEWHLDSDGSTPTESLHSVYMSFLPYFSRCNASKKQLIQLAALINAAVAAGGIAENAVATTFLEALGPSDLLRSLSPMLTREAKARLHA